MIFRTTLRSTPLRSLLTPPSISSASRTFSTHPPLHAPTRNRIYDPIRSPTDLDTLLLLTSSSRTALLTLWTASWCPSCRIIKPLLTQLLEEEGIGEAQGGVAYAEVEFDSPTLGAEVPGRYLITSVPTLLAFSRGEAQMETRVMDGRELRDREFLRLWIEDEAGRGGRGGGGGGFGIGGMFGLGKGG